MQYAQVAILSYLIGAIPFGLIFGRIIGRVDVRQYGSKRTGATNVMRVLGTRWGVTVFVLDFLKGAAGVVVGSLLVGNGWAAALGGIAAVVGHIFPAYVGFRGGRGVATAMGGVAALVPFAFLGALVAWLLTVWLTRYVSLGSILAGVAAAGVTALLLALGKAGMPSLVYGLGIAAIIIVSHHDNIKRLLAGTENKLGQRVKVH